MFEVNYTISGSRDKDMFLTEVDCETREEIQSMLDIRLYPYKANIVHIQAID